MITNERTIEILEEQHKSPAMFISLSECREYNEAIDNAIIAVGYQIPMKPIVMKSIFTGKTMDECPRCKTTVHIFGRCPCCGQAIDWSDYEREIAERTESN